MRCVRLQVYRFPPYRINHGYTEQTVCGNVLQRRTAHYYFEHNPEGHIALPQNKQIKIVLVEKYYIMKVDKPSNLNSKAELIATCRHMRMSPFRIWLNNTSSFSP